MDTNTGGKPLQCKAMFASESGDGARGAVCHATKFPYRKPPVNAIVSSSDDDEKRARGYSVSTMENNGTPKIYAREWRQHLGLSQESVAEAIDSTKGTVSKLETGGLSWRPEWLGKIATVFGLSPSDLFSPPPVELQYVSDETIAPDVPLPNTFGSQQGNIVYKPIIPGGSPEIDVRAGAGEGMVGYVLPTPTGYSGHEVIAEWVFPPPFLRQELKGRPGWTIVMEVQSESMYPTLSPGDRVIVDLSQARLSADGAIYLVSYDGGDPQVKRLHTSDETIDKLNVLSDNPKVPARLINKDRVTIFGRVVGRVSRL